VLPIKHLQNEQIDKQKWDLAIENSHNGLVYALSWYLDIVSPDWEALVLGDYEAVMPLAWRKKFGINYLYQPVFVQKIGIFFQKLITPEITDQFLIEILRHYKFIDICIDNKPKSIPAVKRITQMLDLSESYQELYACYSKNHKKNIEKALNSGLIVKKDGNPDDFITLLLHMYRTKNLTDVSFSDIENLRKIVKEAILQGMGEIYFGYIDNNLCAAAFFLKWNRRSIIFTAQNNKGREIGAMFSLIDYYIQKNASKKQWLDFAGSMLPGVAKRNKGFGANDYEYFAVKVNQLPWPFNFFKK